MHFERGKDIKEAMSLGGYSFDTLRPGAILQITKKFGLSKEEGKIRDFNECSIPCQKNYLMLITRIEQYANGDPKRKTIHFIKHGPNRIPTLNEDRVRIQKKEAFPGWRTTGLMGNMSKRMFDYRLKVIKPGF